MYWRLKPQDTKVGFNKGAGCLLDATVVPPEPFEIFFSNRQFWGDAPQNQSRNW
jgi:hypothetical protein